ncbi:uncharacterized protein N0V89_007081 [Didymosphaeria variabile]|uniref:Metal tolerance protein 3 protein n=1 Tax=Didymosphaeria variabile TaxID=1932322 RepID=A0A9W8XKD6_9PLEO|nr:uncharacterized protein N0V89_007081 [Didymosphaeria variabile]KAJ4351738.1 hypothetical protein N0V89_007081 [Didymosphaeria variabile]
MQLFASLLVALSVFQVAMGASDKFPAAVLVQRQTNPLPTTQVGDPCLDYSVTANMSTISANSSYRAAFMQKAPVGTIITARMLNAAQAKLPALTADVALNQQCGNLTQLAVTEAANNFSNNIVAQFSTEGLPVGIKAGPEVLVIVGAICALFSIVWVFAG